MRKKKKKTKSPMLIVLLLFSLLSLVTCLVLVIFFAPAGEKKPQGYTPNTQVTTDTQRVPDKQVDVDISLEDIEKRQGQETFVIFGVDSREDELGAGTRSDSIMIVHVDHTTGVVKVASVFRDCMVHIEDYGYEKITHAHQYGGPKLALSTVNENFDMQAGDYITVNFGSVAGLVDLLGGIEFTITDAEAAKMGERFSGAGTYLLTGADVVTYTRIRSTAGGDYRRAERQREMLFAIFEKAKDFSAEERIELVEMMLDEIATSYRQDEVVDLLYYLTQYKITDMAAFPEVFYGGRIDGNWVEVPVTLVDMNASLHQFLFGEKDYTPSNRVQSYSNELEGKVSGANTDLREE